MHHLAERAAAANALVAASRGAERAFGEFVARKHPSLNAFLAATREDREALGAALGRWDLVCGFAKPGQACGRCHRIEDDALGATCARCKRFCCRRCLATRSDALWALCTDCLTATVVSGGDGAD